MTYTFRLPRHIWKNYLKEMEPGTASKFIREAILEKINREYSADYADEQINLLMAKVKEWKEKKKHMKADPVKVNNILRAARSTYDAYTRGGLDIIKFKGYLQNNIIPKLRVVGCTDLSLDKIIEILNGGVKYE